MKYRLTNVRFCGNENAGLRRDVIYAELREARSGLLEISATLEHILGTVRDRGLDVEGLKLTWGKRGSEISFAERESWTE